MGSRTSKRTFLSFFLWVVCACGGSGGSGENAASADDTAPLPAGFTDLCAGDSVPALDNVKTTPSHDYIALVRAQLTKADNKLSKAPTIESGTKCGGARNRDKCLADLAALAPDAGIGKSCGVGECTFSFYVYTRGDEVGALSDETALARFVAPLENPFEAALVAHVLADAMSCSAASRVGARQVEGGWEITFTSGYSDETESEGRNRCGGLARYYVVVRSDGSKGESRRVITKAHDRPCGQP